MRKIIVQEFITLDGVMQAPGGPEEGFEEYGGWSAPYYDEGLDEIWLLIHPVTLGTGNKLFADGTIPTTFTLVDCTATPSGVIVAHYKRAGEVKTGTMGV